MVRPNELSFARRGALNKLAARRQGARPSQITAVLVGLDPADDSRVIVSFDGSEVSVLSGPHKLVPGSLVAVEVDSANAPVRVAGPVTTRPEGLDPDAEAPEPVVPMPALAPREFSPADQAVVDQVVADLDQARDDIAAAVDQIGELATKVGFAWSGTFEPDQALFPDSDFRVDWTALGDGQFRFEMVNIPPELNYDLFFDIMLPDGQVLFLTDTNPVIVTTATPGHFRIYAGAGNEQIYVEEDGWSIRPEMMDSGPLQAAIAAAAQAAVTASRIAPRSLYDPTPADGVDRPKNALWTKVNAQGEELAYWSWDGTEWVPQALSRTVIPLLDASHISTGTLDSDRVNATEIWASIATIGRIITEDLIAVGAVTAPALNVVHVDPTTGYGWRADPEGITLLDAEGNPSIVLRTDMENRFSIVQDGVVVASISPEGDVTGRTVAANESLLYRGVELEDRLNSPQVGLVSQIAAINQNAPMQTSMRGVMTVRFTNTTDTDRIVKVTAKLKMRNRDDNMKVAFYGVASTTDQEVQATLGSPVRSEDDYGTTATGQNLVEHIQFFKNSPGQTWSVLVGAKSNNTSTAQYVFQSDNTRMWAEDKGPWREPMFDIQTPDLRGSSTDGTTAKKTYTKTWNSTAHRTYSYTSLTSTHAASSLVQGYMGGANSRGHWIFNAADIRANTAGSTITSGRFKVRNLTTATGTMSAVLRVHNYASAPATFGTSTPWTTVTVASGRDIDVPLPAWIVNGLRDDTIKGFSLDHGGSQSSTFYGRFSPVASVTLNYTK